MSPKNSLSESEIGADLNQLSDLILGKPFFDERGKITSRRVINTESPVKIEISLTSTGIMNGLNATDRSTFISTVRPDRTVFSKGSGILTAEGGEIAMYTFEGLGRYYQDGILRSNGISFLETESTGKLAFLNNLVGIFKNEIDPAGNTATKTWELK